MTISGIISFDRFDILFYFLNDFLLWTWEFLLRLARLSKTCSAGQGRCRPWKEQRVPASVSGIIQTSRWMMIWMWPSGMLTRYVQRSRQCESVLKIDLSRQCEAALSLFINIGTSTAVDVCRDIRELWWEWRLDSAPRCMLRNVANVFTFK